MPSATAVSTAAVAVPTQQEIADRFREIYPELLSRAVAIAAKERDSEEVVQEILSFSWWNYQSAARRGKSLTASQLAWVGMRRVRGEGCSLGSPRTKTDALSPGCRMRGRSRIVYLSSMDERRADDPCRRQFDQAIITGQRNPANEAAVKIDWTALRRQLPGRLRRLLDGIAVGRGTCEIARRLRVSPGRVCQLKDQLRVAVANFFGANLPDWTLA